MGFKNCRGAGTGRTTTGGRSPWFLAKQHLLAVKAKKKKIDMALYCTIFNILG